MINGFDISELVDAASDNTQTPVEIFAPEEPKYDPSFIDEKRYKRDEVILIASSLLAQSFNKNRCEHINSNDAEAAVRNARTLIDSVDKLTKPHLKLKRIFVQYNKLSKSGVIRFFNTKIVFKHISTPKTFSEYNGYSKYITLFNYRIKINKYK